MTLDFAQFPHRRQNLLTGEWVLVSPHRLSRPWQGQLEATETQPAAPYDPTCYMCPGNVRANGASNPKYEGTFAFTNDFAALVADAPRTEAADDGLLRAKGEPGICRVVCFSPRHDLALSRMDVDAIRHVVDLWVAERAELAARAGVGYVQIFENRGAMMGASNPHPHGQIWASASVPNEVMKEHAQQRAHWQQSASDLLGDYMRIELGQCHRVVCDNATFVAVVPFWAVWPFETLIIPRRRIATIDELGDDERTGLARMLKDLLTRYDTLFGVPCPYSMGFHEAAADGGAHPEWRWHAHIYPPLLRSATVRKFMVGYELLAMPQRDTTPEEAAERLRSQGSTIAGARQEFKD